MRCTLLLWRVLEMTAGVGEETRTNGGMGLVGLVMTDGEGGVTTGGWDLALLLAVATVLLIVWEGEGEGEWEWEWEGVVLRIWPNH